MENNLKKYPFCEKLKKVRQCNDYYKKKSDGRNGVTEVRYSAALVEDTYYDGAHCGHVGYQPEALNFCPVCGTKIKK